jgi:hypothetical protein
VLGTDGSVLKQKAMYSWILSMTSDVIVADARGGGCLPPPAGWLHPKNSLKCLEAVSTIYAGLHWILDLLKVYPCMHPLVVGQTPALPAYADNIAILWDIKWHLEQYQQSPTFANLHPDHDIIQGICTPCAQLPINSIVFSHVKSHPD